MRAIKTVIPFKSENPKSRLSSVLTEEERKVFVRLSLENVLQVLKEAGIRQLDILSKGELDSSFESSFSSLSETDFEIRIIHDERDLNTAVNSYLKTSDTPVLIVMADLALLTKENIEAMTTETTAIKMISIESDTEIKNAYENIIRIAPGKDGGTNMMYIGAPHVFEVNYYGESFKKHKEEAEKKNLVCEIHESFYAAADMDEPEDLNDILNHGSGKILKFINETLVRD